MTFNHQFILGFSVSGCVCELGHESAENESDLVLAALRERVRELSQECLAELCEALECTDTYEEEPRSEEDLVPSLLPPRALDDGTQENDALPLEDWSRDRLLVSLASWGFVDLLNVTDANLRELVRCRAAARLLSGTHRCGDVVCDVCGDESNSETDLICGRAEVDENDLDKLITEPCQGHYRDRCDPEVRRTLVLSTAHLTAADGKLFEEAETGGLSIIIDKVEYGYQLWVGNKAPEGEESSWGYSQEDIDDAGFTTDLVRIAKLAQSVDCTYIVFDQDGPRTHLLPRYEW